MSIRRTDAVVSPSGHFYETHSLPASNSNVHLRSSASPQKRLSPKKDSASQPHESPLRAQDWWASPSSRSNQSFGHENVGEQTITPVPNTPSVEYHSDHANASPFAYYSAYTAANQPEYYHQVSPSHRSPVQTQESPGVKQENSSLHSTQGRTAQSPSHQFKQSIYHRSPGPLSVTSAQSSDLEDCASERSRSLSPTAGLFPAIPEVNAEFHEPTPEFQEAPESLSQVPSRADLNSQSMPYLPPQEPSLQSPNNEIKREAQNVQPLDLSGSTIIHRPAPIRREFDGDSSLGKQSDEGVDYCDEDDEEQGLSILNSLPTPRVPSSRDHAINKYYSDYGPELVRAQANGPPSGPVSGPVSGPPSASSLGPSAHSFNTNPHDNRTGVLAQPFSEDDFGLASVQQLAPPMSSHGHQRRKSGSYSPQVSRSSNSEGSTQSGDSILGSESPRMGPSRPRSTAHSLSGKPNRRQSYYDFGKGGAASIINLNLSDAVANEQGQNGLNALLPRMKTIELYRKNAKKSNDPELEFQLAQYMMQTALIASSHAKDTSNGKNKHGKSSSTDLTQSRSASQSERRDDGSASSSANSHSGSGELPFDEKFIANLTKDAMSSLKRLSERGYAEAQYLLGDIYSSPAINGTPDMEKSFKYFAMAGKHNHAEAAYRTALCLQEGWGTSRDANRALQFYKSAAVRNQPGALYQLGMAYFYGGMGLPDNSANRQAGVKWLTRAVNNSDTTYNRAPYELGKIFEVGYKDLVIPDEAYSAKLYSRSAELGFVPAAARLGRAYEYGELKCPQDPSLSIHFYTIAALGNDPNAQLAMCAWYMVGAGPSFPVNREEAYEWCLRAALNKLPKAQYTLGFFLENGFGIKRNLIEASKWYQKAAANGYEKAVKRVKEMGLPQDDKPKGKCILM